MGVRHRKNFFTDPIWYFYLYWLPKFFRYERLPAGDSGHIGLPLIIIYNFSVIGSIGGGMAYPRLSTKLECRWAKAPPLHDARLRVA